MRKRDVAANTKFKDESNLKKTSVKKNILSKIFLLCFVIFIGVGVYFFHKFDIKYYFNIAENFLNPKLNKIASQDGRTNILVMGVGDAGHEGENLTDTMLFVSISLDKPSITVISIPRDLWIPEIRAKINAAYFWGDKDTPYFSNKNFPGGKIGFAKSITQEVLGVPINYGVVLNFSAFEKIIDDMGGIDVEVENSFTDKFYPIAGRENDTCGGDRLFSCRYETVTFNKGLQHMDGATALKFVRSRHADGVEGGDLAREARQQKVIDAIKRKILTRDVLLNLQTDLKLWNDFNNSLVRDFDDSTAAILARLIFNSQSLINKNIIPNNLLYMAPAGKTYDWQEVLIPVDGNGKWNAIHAWVSQVIR